MLPTGHEPLATAVGRNACLTRAFSRNTFRRTFRRHFKVQSLTIIIDFNWGQVRAYRTRTCAYTYLYIVARQQYFVIQRPCPPVTSVVVGEKSVTQLYSTGRYCFGRNTDGNDNDAARLFRPGTNFGRFRRFPEYATRVTFRSFVSWNMALYENHGLESRVDLEGRTFGRTRRYEYRNSGG